MSSASDHLMVQNGRANGSKVPVGSGVLESTVIRNNDIEGKKKLTFLLTAVVLFLWTEFLLRFALTPVNQRAVTVEWMNGIVPNLNFPVRASPEELRACLIDGTVLLQLLNKLRPGYACKVAYLFCFFIVELLMSGRFRHLPNWFDSAFLF